MVCLVSLAWQGQYPLLPITNATAPWALPDPSLPYPVGPNPGLAFQPGDGELRKSSTPANNPGLLLGDIRARLHVGIEAAAAGAPVTAQIFWRRRDPNPNE